MSGSNQSGQSIYFSIICGNSSSNPELAHLFKDIIRTCWKSAPFHTKGLLLGNKVRLLYTLNSYLEVEASTYLGGGIYENGGLAGELKSPIWA
jgi:hypothetical protein